MQATPDVLTIEPALHPNPRVRQVGFDLGHRYVEQCWTAVIGPTSVLLLRRVATLWQEAVPARVRVGELATSLGLSGFASAEKRFWHTVDRLAKFGLVSLADGGTLDVFTKVAPLSTRQLERLPEWTVSAHHRLIDDQIERLTEAQSACRDPATSIANRLDRLERLPSPASPTLSR